MYDIQGRLDRLQREVNRAGAYVSGGDFYALRVAPFCPPDKRLHMRGGRTYLGYNWGWAVFDDYEQRVYTVPDLIADLADPASVTVDVTFSNAGYFQFFILELALPAVVEEPETSDWGFYLHGTGAEFATEADAEESINSTTFQESEAWEHGADGSAYPLCGVVLQNDGQIEVSGAFLPIDVVNRGRSYIWPRDLRSRFQLYK